MKSKFFGINAKLALAILAVGSLFTSCYDKEDGDVNIPYVAPDAVYTVTGSITDASTGLPVAASISGIGSTAITTAADGSFRVQLADKIAKDATKAYALVITASGYTTVNRALTVTGIANGLTATYVVNAALSSTTYDDSNVTVTTNIDDINSIPNTLTAKEYVGLDLVNDKNAAITMDKVFQVASGVKELTAAQRAAATSLREYAEAYVKANVGDYSKGITLIDRTFGLHIPPMSSVISVTITTNLITETFGFTKDGVTITIQTQRVAGYGIQTNTLPNEIYHGHGHGHGHGGDLNAGGGIIDAE